MTSPKQMAVSAWTRALVLLIFVNAVTSFPVIFRNLPQDVTLGEFALGERWVYDFDLIDPLDDLFTCDPTIEVTGGSGTPAVLPEFEMIYDSAREVYELWVTTDADFEIATHDITEFRVHVTCVDARNFTSSSYLDVKIKSDERVTINNVVGNNNGVTRLAQSTPAGTYIKTITASSLLGHDLTYNITTEYPDWTENGPFFYIEPNTGDLYTIQDLEYAKFGEHQMALTITVTDETDGIKVREIQRININGANHVPTSPNAPITITVDEHTSSGINLNEQLQYTDPDINQYHTFRCTTSNPVCEDTIVIDELTGEIEVASGQTLDHEAADVCQLQCYVDDGLHEGGPYQVTVYITDLNDPPVFQGTMFYLTVSEGAKGSATYSPGFSCSDEDVGDSTTFTMTTANNSEWFYIDPYSGDMMFDVDYDVDDTNTFRTQNVLTVCCTDESGATDCGQITIDVTDINDNNPVFADSYTIYYDQFDKAGDIIGGITPTDADISNVNLVCTGSPVADMDYGDDFDMDGSCNFYLSTLPGNQYEYGQHTLWTVTATDDGGKTAETTVDLVYRETVTTTTTTTTQATTTEYNFLDHGENIAMLVLLLLMAAILLGLLGWCLARFCCGCCGGTGGGRYCNCMQRSTRTKMPRQPQQVYPSSQPPPYTPQPHVGYMPVTKTRFVHPGPGQLFQTASRLPQSRF